MSTINKIDKVHRLNKVARRDAIRALHRVIPQIPTSIGRGIAMVAAAGLEDIRRAPFLTGTEKQAKFDRTIDRLQGNPEDV